MKPTTAWTFYDWANSAFALVITAAVFPGYFLKVTDEMIRVGPFYMSNSALYAYMISFAYLLVSLGSPFFSAFADSANNKKMMLFIFALIGSISCMCLYFFDGMAHIKIGIFAFILSYIGFIGSLVFYNTFLIEITTEDKFDNVSAKGFSMGYIGSVSLLLINLMLIKYPNTFGISSSGEAARVSFLMVGIWWILFTIVPLRYLPGSFKLSLNERHTKNSFTILVHVWNKLKQLPVIRKFLVAFFAYNAGVITIMLLAATFAEKELHFETSELIILILLLQIVAIGGAFLFSKISEIKGNKFSLLIMILIWIVICIVGYIIKNKVQFYILASFVGLVMGGIQSLSRSTYSKLIKDFHGEYTSFFSFYDIVDKVSVLIGTLSFGAIEHITGSIRNSILALLLFFIIGAILLYLVPLDEYLKKEKNLKDSLILENK